MRDFLGGIVVLLLSASREGMTSLDFSHQRDLMSECKALVSLTISQVNRGRSQSEVIPFWVALRTSYETVTHRQP